MTGTTVIKNALIVNEGDIQLTDVTIEHGLITHIGDTDRGAEHTIDAEGNFLLPGIIDSHVHFREPGLCHKGDIRSESRAAVAGGITSFLEMPNTLPLCLTLEDVQHKNDIAAHSAMANYGFYLGACNKNLDYITSLKPGDTFCVTDDGLYQLGDSLMLSETPEVMDALFSRYRGLIAIHSEDEELIRYNLEVYENTYGAVPFTAHAEIRNFIACYLNTKKAVAVAQRGGANLHLLHITTAAELALLNNQIPLPLKSITAEVCLPHLWFNSNDYQRLGAFIKCNPAIKSSADRNALINAVNNDLIDIISTDHAPHTLEEKEHVYQRCPSGMPMVQHALPAMLELYLDGKIGIEKIVEKMCHNPAVLFGIKNRGYIREGYHADLVLVDINKPWTVAKGNILYKCGWSPFEGQTFSASVTHTFVNGNLAYHNGTFNTFYPGQALQFIKRV